MYEDGAIGNFARWGGLQYGFDGSSRCAWTSAGSRGGVHHDAAIPRDFGYEKLDFCAVTVTITT